MSFISYKYSKMSCMIYLKNYVLVNGFLWLGGTLTYTAYNLTQFPQLLLCATFIKNVVIARFIMASRSDLSYTRGGERDSSHDYLYLTKVSIFDSFSLMLLLPQTVDSALLYDIFTFIPKSFVYEILFDFCHYWMHRFIHGSPRLYGMIHATHHAQIYIDPYKAFYQSFPDLLLTNLVPLFIATYCVPVSPHFLFVFFWYKTFIEVAGHIGKPIRATSFPQCILLPRLLGIALHAEDHEYHHLRPNKNFAKRFALWDRVFQTYSSVAAADGN